MSHAQDNSEEWHIHISPARLIAGSFAFVLFFFIFLLILMAYTPILEFLPGYRTAADRAHESLVENIMRLDSMERMMNDMMTYNENIALIMEGKTPVSRTISQSDSMRQDRVAVKASHLDSVLRNQMEQEGIYSLAGNETASRRKLRETMELSKPAEGIITAHFDLSHGIYGVQIAAEGADRITAIDNGTVIFKQWTPELSYVVMIQHAGNLVSVYKNLSSTLIEKGQSIRNGEQIGYNIEKEAQQEGDAKLFEFELWSNGKPVDPEEYILF